MPQKNNGKFVKSISKLKKKKICRKRYNNYNNSPFKEKPVNFLQNELQNSTTHGLPYIINTRLHYLEKIFWIVNFVVCITVMIVLLNMQYSRFITAPTVMSVERNYFDWNISYPTITLCPLYKPDPVKFKKFINDTYEMTGMNLQGYLWAISQAALDTLEYLDLNSPNDEVQMIDPKDYARMAAILFKKFEKGWLATNANWTIPVDAAMTEMGMCHVINSNVAVFDMPLIWDTPPIYIKKNVELSVFEADFFTLITDYANIYKVFIHSPDEVTMTTGSSFAFDVEGLISFGLSVWSTRISEELRYKSLRLQKCRLKDYIVDYITFYYI